ncbi:MAG TPA: glycerophosphodiester phosphodiesterase [Pyrinomonadaceae bacterium]|jgi:glycerophosphoryl diester phosphodiesterase
MIGAIYGSLAWHAGVPAAAHSFLQRDALRPLVIAHRGGAGLWPENTAYAFEHAKAAGVDVIEMDVRSTSDGVPVVIHDATVDRTTDGNGRVADKTLGQLKALDAGYRWSADGGRSFPVRGKGITVPTVEEVFTSLRDMRFIIEPKPDVRSPVEPLCRAIREHGMSDRIIVGSFNQTILDEFRQTCPGVATSASPAEVSKFLALYKAGLSTSYSPTMQALQVPENAAGLHVLSRGFVEAAHERNLAVHAWTVNEASVMSRLLDMGVDGIMTDYPDRLMTLLVSKSNHTDNQKGDEK